MEKTVCPYGSWKSKISADVVVSSGKEFKDIFTDIENKTVYWVEGRPEEEGRYAIVKARGSVSEPPVDILPRGYYARSMVYEYGGGSALLHDDMLFFVNYDSNKEGCDQQIYRMKEGEYPVKITHQSNMKYAEGVYCKALKKLLYIREDSNIKNKGYNVTEIVAVDPEGIELPKVLLSYPKESDAASYERDFYSSIAVNDRGNKIAWLAWNFRNMPWDSNELWQGEISEDGELINIKKTAGNCLEGIDGKDSQSLIQPLWLLNDELCAVSDLNQWWNLYKYKSDRDRPELLSILPHNIDSGFEFGTPQWYLGSSCYTRCGKRIAAAFNNPAEGWKLLIIDPDNIENNKILTLKYDSQGLSSDITEISQIRSYSDNTIVCHISSSHIPSHIIKVPFDEADDVYRVKEDDILGRSGTGTEEYKAYISSPEHISFKVNNTVGNVLQTECYGLYYKPHNPDYKGDDQEKAPLLILAHGGPTGAASREINWTIQYFTSRGIAVVDMNYRGSTGYGREYRLSLYRNWGLYDRDDCVGVVEYLSSAQGKEIVIDSNRVLARGGSAGGYLSLVLATFTRCCKAVASYYGISDLKTLTEDTHKFEAFYPYELVGDLHATVKSYEMRSPVNSINLLDCAMIFFQGEEDKVVPPSQTEVMVEELKAKGKPVAELLFPNEAHGFKRAENIKKALESEYYFYSQVLGFKPSDDLEPVKIWNKEGI